MNKDIRLLVSFKGHRKRIKLQKRVGVKAVLCLIDLWLTAAEDAPEGNLIGWDQEDISIAGGWDEEPKKFIDALIQCGFLEKNEHSYRLHDWDEHQSWACGSKKRTEAARSNALKRWEKRLTAQCDRNATAMQPHKNGNAPSPIPSPIPSPLINKCPSANAAILPKETIEDMALPKVEEEIFKLCKELYDEKIFTKSHQFANLMLKQQKSQRAVLHSLIRVKIKSQIQKFEDTEGKPWAYAMGVMKDENGNFNERDHEKDSGQVKR